MSLHKDLKYKILIKAHILDLVWGLQIAHIKTSLGFAWYMDPLEYYKALVYTTRESFHFKQNPVFFQPL